MSNKKKGSSLSGMLSETVTVRKVRGQVVVTNRPRRRPGPTEKQATAQRKFLEASQYASRQIAQDESKALFSSGITDKKRSVYLVSMSDYLSVPKVSYIDTLGYRGAVGDSIVVRAVDDFMVTKVKVIIADAAGSILEEGEAGPDALRVNLWEYKATVANPKLSGTTVLAVAYDRPGNTGTAEVVL